MGINGNKIKQIWTNPNKCEHWNADLRWFGTMQTNNGILGYNQACMMTDSRLMQTQEHIQTNVN